MGSIANASTADFLRLENSDVGIPRMRMQCRGPSKRVGWRADNSYLPFVGQRGLRDIAAAHVSAMERLLFDGRRVQLPLRKRVSKAPKGSIADAGSQVPSFGRQLEGDGPLFPKRRRQNP
jgi:hypothetical protein